MVIENCPEVALKAVDDLFEFRDLFFKNHSFENADKREELIRERLDETLANQLRPLLGDDKEESLERVPGLVKDATILYAIGRAMNVAEKYSKIGHECLAKSVKLNPESSDGWYELGESFWMKGELKRALSCFEGKSLQLLIVHELNAKNSFSLYLILIDHL